MVALFLYRCVCVGLSVCPFNHSSRFENDCLTVVWCLYLSMFSICNCDAVSKLYWKNYSPVFFQIVSVGCNFKRFFPYFLADA
jgi:hypothetical protein